MNEVNLITMKTETAQTHSDYVAYCENEGSLVIDPLFNGFESVDIKYAKVNEVVGFARLDNKGSSKYLKNREHLGSQGYSLESDTFDSLTNSWTLKKTTLYASSEETKKLARIAIHDEIEDMRKEISELKLSLYELKTKRKKQEDSLTKVVEDNRLLTNKIQDASFVDKLRFLLGGKL